MESKNSEMSILLPQAQEARERIARTNAVQEGEIQRFREEVTKLMAAQGQALDMATQQRNRCLQLEVQHLVLQARNSEMERTINSTKGLNEAAGIDQTQIAQKMTEERMKEERAVMAEVLVINATLKADVEARIIELDNAHLRKAELEADLASARAVISVRDKTLEKLEQQLQNPQDAINLQDNDHEDYDQEGWYDDDGKRFANAEEGPIGDLGRRLAEEEDAAQKAIENGGVNALSPSSGDAYSVQGAGSGSGGAYGVRGADTSSAIPNKAALPTKATTAANTTRPVGTVEEDDRAVTTEVVMQPDGIDKTVGVSSRAYEKLQVPQFPKYGDMTNGMTQLDRNVVACTPYMGFTELEWLKETYTRSFEELADSGPPRMKRLDLVLSTRIAVIIHKSVESLSEDVFLADREAWDRGDSLRGRQMIWLILDFFKTHRSMAEQYSYEDLKRVQWLGDARIKEFYDNYRLIMNAIMDQLPKVATQITMFYNKIKGSKLLEIDLREFDRYDEGDERRTLRVLEKAVERVIARKD